MSADARNQNIAGSPGEVTPVERAGEAGRPWRLPARARFPVPHGLREPAVRPEGAAVGVMALAVRQLREPAVRPEGAATHQPRATPWEAWTEHPASPERAAQEPVRPAGRRRGVSLLEVLFSIGIVAVGMLGVLILLPVGGSRVTRGSVADHADRVGRSAIREFHVQHMGQPNRQYAPTLNPALSGQLATINGNAFCIDPLFIAQHLNTTNNSVSQEVGCFPCVVPAAVMDTRMRRITLCTLPGSNAPLLALQAQQLFLNKDDLLFDLPADRTLAPTQQFGAGNTQRQFEGRFSWLATIAPKETVPNGVWVLSIVVFHRRDLAMTLPSATPSGDEPENERLVDVVFAEAGTTYGTGLGGGDMLLRTRTVQNPNPQRPRVDLALREGEWVMLIGTKAYQSGGQTQHLRRFKWYRVQSLEPDIQQSGNFYERHVTLFGQDWDTTLTTQAVLINGVVAVYEKIIRSESSSLWTEQ